MSSAVEIRQDPVSVSHVASEHHVTEAVKVTPTTSVIPPPSLSSSSTLGTSANLLTPGTPAVQTQVPMPPSLPSSHTPDQTALNLPNLTLSSAMLSPSHASSQLMAPGGTSSITAAAASSRDVPPTIFSSASQTAASLPRHPPGSEHVTSSVIQAPPKSSEAPCHDDQDREVAKTLPDRRNNGGNKIVSVDGSLWYAEWLKYFHDASEDPKWVELVSRWLQFESLGPPVCKVCFLS